MGKGGGFPIGTLRVRKGGVVVIKTKEGWVAKPVPKAPGKTETNIARGFTAKISKNIKNAPGPYSKIGAKLEGLKKISSPSVKSRVEASVNKRFFGKTSKTSNSGETVKIKVKKIDTKAKEDAFLKSLRKDKLNQGSVAQNRLDYYEGKNNK